MDNELECVTFGKCLPSDLFSYFNLYTFVHKLGCDDRYLCTSKSEQAMGILLALESDGSDSFKLFQHWLQGV